MRQQTDSTLSIIFLFLFIYSFTICSLEETPHHFDKCSHYDFNKHQQPYSYSKINIPFRAIPWDFCWIPFLQPFLVLHRFSREIKKELVYMTPGINVIPTRLCQHQEPDKWPLWLKCKGTPEIEVVLCCLEVGREQFNCHFVGTHRGLCSCNLCKWIQQCVIDSAV